MTVQRNTKRCMILVASALLLLAVSLAEATPTCGRRWCQYTSIPQCLNESSALTRCNSKSLHGCVFKASSTPDDLMLQWNKQTGVCSLFHYQHVCRMMQASGARPIGGSQTLQHGAVQSQSQSQSQCSVYRALSLASCDASFDAHLIGVWLAGGSNRFSNLVCQDASAGGHRLESVNLQWTEEGARFDGQSSYALLNDSRFVSSDTSASFTWLMRLKREPRVQPFLEAVSCSDPNTIGYHLWEFDQANRIYFWRLGPSSDSKTFFIYSKVGLLPASSESWIDIGLPVNRGNLSLSALYFNGGFAELDITGQITASWYSCFILSIGHRLKNNGPFLKGVVRAVAIANVSMTEAQIRDFFVSLP